MKLLGAELANFACFDRQFVPLRDGVTVLVGLNNAGKTAILRGMSALHTMPVGDVKQGVPTDLNGYFRADGSARLDILCSLDEADATLFDKSQGPPDSQVFTHWFSAVQDKAVARWEFSLGQSGIQLQRCRLEIPSKSGDPKLLDLVLRQSNTYVSQRFRFPDFTPTSQSQANIRSGKFGHSYDFGPQLSAPLQHFSSVKLVNPHRVVQDTQQLQTTMELPGNAYNLAQFLQTLSGRDRDTYLAIEKFVTGVFPEFKYVNAVSGLNNQVSIELTESTTGRRIPLPNCGTGVEQILTLATFVLTTQKPGLILLDEPHSYLHPTAERALVDFLQEHPEHKYLISTHSAVLMNSVEPDRIVYVAPPGRPYSAAPERTEASKVLFDLGYRNSDSLFHDRLVFVEGKSDKEIIPILLL